MGKSSSTNGLGSASVEAARLGDREKQEGHDEQPTHQAGSLSFRPHEKKQQTRSPQGNAKKVGTDLSKRIMK
jgi:hypothetical protein